MIWSMAASGYSGRSPASTVRSWKEYGIEPRRNEIGDYGFVKYDVRKLHNLLYYEGKDHTKEDDPWA